MLMLTVRGILYPFMGTILGSALVFFLKNKPSTRFMAILDSLAAGIMCAASFFSLILPAVSQAENQGIISSLSCSTGFFAGIMIFILLSFITGKAFSESDMSGNMLVWAVSLHNIPEGMAVGVVYAGLLSGNGSIGAAAALALSVGIALQNIPEGAIVSLPAAARGRSKACAFILGMLSGVAELISSVITLFLASFVYSVLPFSLCFAAGAMFYVVMSELSGNFTDKRNCSISLAAFALGFIIMMLLDTLLG